jgi:hypothetical protein
MNYPLSFDVKEILITCLVNLEKNNCKLYKKRYDISNNCFVKPLLLEKRINNIKILCN